LTKTEKDSHFPVKIFRLAVRWFNRTTRFLFSALICNIFPASCKQADREAFAPKPNSMKQLPLFICSHIIGLKFQTTLHAQPPGYTYGKQITINASQVGGSLSFNPFLIAILLLLFINKSIGQGGNCLDFDGSNDYVTLNSLAGDMSGSTNFTIEFWVKGPQSQPTLSGQAGLFSINTSIGGNVLLFVMGTGLSGQQWDGKIYVFDGATGFYQINGPFIGDNIWHQIIYSRNGSSASLMVDGIAAGSHAPAYSFAANDLWSIAQEYDFGPLTSDFFKGQIDGLKIYNGSTLVGDYGFDQGTAGGNNAGQTTLTDGSGNSNSGTLLNFALSGSTSNWVASSAPLPVELLDFQAKPNENNALLTWRTASEQNNHGFYIEKSLDGRQFESIGFVVGNGFSNEGHRYFFEDKNFLADAYYRLRQLDFDGKNALSPVVFLAASANSPFAAYTIPTTNELLLKHPPGLTGPFTILLFDVGGRLVFSSIITESQTVTSSIDLKGLPPGTYFLRLRHSSVAWSGRILVGR
jgi:hypothetical protein